MIKCKECNKEFSQNGYNSHFWRAHTEEGKSHNLKCNNFTKREIWNKGLKKETDERVNKYAESISKTVLEQVKNGTYKPRRMSIKARKELSERQSKKNSGGRCKWFTVDGRKVQGTWERDFALLLEKNNIEWIRPNVPFVYEMEGKIKRYTPDFYLVKYDIFIEVKGWWWRNDKEKMKLVIKQHPELKKRIKILRTYKKLGTFVDEVITLD